MSKKQVFSLFLAIMLTMSMLAGCGNTSKKEVTANDNVKEEAKSEDKTIKEFTALSDGKLQSGLTAN